MTVYVLTGTTIGTGNAFAFGAADDELIVAPGAVIGSSTGDAIADVAFNNTSVTILGTIGGSNEFRMSGDNARLHVGLGGSWIGTEQVGGNTTIYMQGNAGLLRNDGTISSLRSIGVLTGSTANIINTGLIEAASAVWLGLTGAGGSLLNSGSIISGIGTSADSRFHNGVEVDNSSLINNLGSGLISASADGGAGVNFSFTAGGSTLTNHGTIVSVQDWGVDLSTVNSGQALIRVFNSGVIEGSDGSYQGSQNADSLVNQGEMLGAVDMGAGNDTLDNRGGTIEGEIDLGDGDDTFFLGAGVEIADGGSSLVDAINVTTGAGGVIDLTNEGLGTGLALGDILVGFERVYGSKSGVDIVYGNTASNLIYTYGGNDEIFADLGADAIYAGRGADTITGGAGNDTFGYQFINEFGDTITDFSSTSSGNDDRFTFRASNIGGGLVAGPLDPAKFQARADNVADANDRFIFRTTDTTLWFDVDGAGGVGPVMVADLQAGAIVTAADIILV